MKQKINHVFGTILLFILISTICVSLQRYVINPILNKYGDTTIGYVTRHHRLRHNELSGYSYYVSGKEYRGKCRETTNSIIEIRYFRKCPRIHTIDFTDVEKQEKD